MSETPTSTDRVELTEDERAQLRSHGQKWAEDAQLGDLFFEPVESIVAARVQALTADLDAAKRWNTAAKIERDAARAELAAANARAKDADEWQARMVLAHTALEARCAELEAQRPKYDYEIFGNRDADFMQLQADFDAQSEVLVSLRARCAELAEQGWDAGAKAEANSWRAERDALQETLDRVTAALNRVDWWHHPGVWNDTCPGRPTRLHWTRPGQLEAKCRDCGFALVGMDADGEAIRAALTPEGKP